MTEGQIHRAVVAQLHARAYPDALWFHVPNGGRRNPIEGAQFKRMGVLPGVADLILIHQGNAFGLELKTETGRASVSQMEFQSRLTSAGGFGCIANGLDRAIRCLEQWRIMR